MVYALASKGFRPRWRRTDRAAGDSRHGERLRRGAEPGESQHHARDTRSFKSDSLWNYELGAKTAWLDHRVTLNAAAFDIRWKNIQQQILLPCGFQFISNAGAAESKGGELELRARATESLEASLGIGLSGCDDHREGRLAAAGRLAGIPGAQLDRQRLAVVHNPLTSSLEPGQWARLLVHRQELQRQQQSELATRAAGLPPPGRAFCVHERVAANSPWWARTSPTKWRTSATTARSPRRYRGGRGCS